MHRKKKRNDSKESDFDEQIVIVRVPETVDSVNGNWFQDNTLFASITISIEEIKAESKVKRSVGRLIFTLDVNHQLLLLSRALNQIILKTVHLCEAIFHSILILFGLCESRAKYIYNAFVGSSSFRIFSFQ